MGWWTNQINFHLQKNKFYLGNTQKFMAFEWWIGIVSSIDRETYRSSYIGEIKWLVVNNACNEGNTITEILQLSRCDKAEFSCNGGKCLKTSQRCKTIEDCDDVSDEKNCRTVYLDPEKYLKSKHPPSNQEDSKFPIVSNLILQFLIHVSPLWVDDNPGRSRSCPVLKNEIKGKSPMEWCTNNVWQH